jgi:hypothetical protein
VVVEEEGVGAPARLLAVYGRRTVVRTKLASLEASLGEELFDEIGGLLEGLSLRRDAWLPAEELEQPHRVVCDSLKVRLGHHVIFSRVGCANQRGTIASRAGDLHKRGERLVQSTASSLRSSIRR